MGFPWDSHVWSNKHKWWRTPSATLGFQRHNDEARWETSAIVVSAQDASGFAMTSHEWSNASPVAQ